MTNATATAAVPSTVLLSTIAWTTVIVFGIFGNLLALFILHRARLSSNKKIVFMLRCLATSDCIALVCMLVRPFVKYKWPNARNNLWMCRSHVVFRFFVWSSGCVALVMAVDRWLALTKPFFYQTHISLRILKRMMVILLLEVLCLMFAPFFGFGVYWDEKSFKCANITEYKKPSDEAYVYIYVSQGFILCITIVYMNLSILNVLCKKDSVLDIHNGLTSHFGRGLPLTRNAAATKDERLFAWLMLIMSVGGILCLVPKLLAIMLVKFISNKSTKNQLNFTVDVLLAIHFALDPCLNVLYRWKLVKSACSRSKNKNNKVSREQLL